MRVGITEKVFKVRGQRSRSYVYKCMNAMVAKACRLFRWCGVDAQVFVSMLMIVWACRSSAAR